MNISLHKPLTGIALSCMLLCSTILAHESTGTKIAKTTGHALLATCGLLCAVAGARVAYSFKGTSFSWDPVPSMARRIPNWKLVILGSCFVVPGIYTAYKNIRNIIDLYETKYKPRTPRTRGFPPYWESNT